jgi:FtsZ-binding cell division protein ZapB
MKKNKIEIEKIKEENFWSSYNNNIKNIVLETDVYTEIEQFKNKNQSFLSKLKKFLGF